MVLVPALVDVVLLPLVPPNKELTPLPLLKYMEKREDWERLGRVRILVLLMLEEEEEEEGGTKA